MALDWLKEPVSPEAPAGPDLELAEADAFLDYYYDAEGRLPGRYVTTGQQVGADGRALDRLFDPGDVDLTAERRAITDLLRQSRDLRLLSLLARWEVLARDVTGLADAMEGMANVLAAFGDVAHPALPDRARDRRAAIETLNVQAAMLQPLQYLPLNGDPQVTWRRWQVTQGRAEARAGEDDASADGILSGLTERGNAATVTGVQADLGRCLNAARSIDTGLLAPLIELLEGILGLIAQARPELAPPEPVDEQKIADEDAAPEEETTPLAETRAAGDLTSRGEARAALGAVEAYLARVEPSSAALLLVIQARQLIGRPLVEAIETLLPENAAKAVIDFGPETGFALSMDRLKALSADIPAPEADDSPAPAPHVDSRPSASAQLRVVETWFRRSEPASPIPLLLSRARGWLEKDFEAILGDLLPSSESG